MGESRNARLNAGVFGVRRPFTFANPSLSEGVEKSTRVFRVGVCSRLGTSETAYFEAVLGEISAIAVLAT